MKDTLSLFKEYLDYCPDTGIFFWKKSPVSWIPIGTEAGATTSNGYRVLSIKRQKYLSHRVAWFFITGEYPTKQIDHINHNRSDNSQCNLRLVTESENKRNQRLRADNKSGVCGVVWDKNSNSWKAQLRIDNVNMHLGRSKSFFEACCLRKSAELKYNFHENHGV
jgi:hypothetical protein